MRVLVLGSAAGGGFPQWNCRCPLCEGVRLGTVRARCRTQSSIAISVDDRQWLLINASPDLRQQMQANPALWPRQGMRHNPFCGVLLTDAQIDHVTGLLLLREGLPMDLYCTPSVQEELTRTFPLLPVLSHWNGGYRPQPLPESAEQMFSLPAMPGLQWRVIPLHSNAPPFSPRRDAPRAGDNIGLFVRDPASKRSLFYAPGLGMITPVVQTFMEHADCLLVDGTCWSDDEMGSVGGTKKARDMGHLPLTGGSSMISTLSGLGDGKRKILIHINNTNPILNEDSAQRQYLNSLEIEVAYDGMEICL